MAIHLALGVTSSLALASGITTLVLNYMYAGQHLGIIGSTLCLSGVMGWCVLLMWRLFCQQFGPFNHVFEEGRMAGYARGYYDGRRVQLPSVTTIPRKP